MEGLRLILLIAGLLVIAGVYAYTRMSSAARSRRRDDDDIADDEEPTLNADFDDEFPDDLPPLHAVGVTDEGAEQDEKPASTQPRDERIIVLNILPTEPGGSFPGADLLDVFDRAGLEYGQFGVFHRIKETHGGPQSVFSVASATEPGSFEITGMAEESFRGLSLFMVLPGPMRGVDAFADMLATARRIAEQIRGDVKDRNRSTLTRQTAHHVREEIIAFEHRQTIKT
ncbi:MAG TPA: cell division protein ZipA [Gammaproteobacteria bacterium]